MMKRLLPKNYLNMNPSTALVMAMFGSGLTGLAIGLVQQGQLLFVLPAILTGWITFHSSYIGYAIRRDRRKNAD